MNDMNRQELPSYLQTEAPSRRNPLQWWFRISCIPEPAPTAPLIQREKFRRARLASIILLLLQVYAITSLPAGFFGTNKMLAFFLFGAIAANTIAMICNRHGYITAAGLLIVGNVMFTTTSNILTTPGGLSLSTLPLFDLQVIYLVLCASILPAYYVFIFAGLSSAFTILGILFLPHQPDLAAALPIAGVGLISLPIAIQLVVAFLAFLWVRSATQAIARADRAEQIALLERDIAESRQQIAEQKERLEAAIQEISQALLHANTGRGFTKISTQSNPLWNIIGPINNMIARMERSRQLEYEYQQLITELEGLLKALRQARTHHHLIQFPVGKGNTRLHVLYKEIAQLQRDMLQPKQAPFPLIPDN
ncbi:hypothetical protein EI42_00532 [Thermosporothrix hazakensis]|jgi:Tfp pilus assembly protein PilE|uniref:HAMP domain-containing protein n=2 Tax=Thermosporothrix TaxID=768650 RepID=A0A326UD12_THEHA|nr:hypothetical protein [Thermosporothrix hazakensis]PZW36358.1 hypothetical protein EI42_00532 [Thermosporothrix hazakensis]BBH88823.1 hypothetical protein KTC_35740 [Thermosporothrix sp. COM3]GCE47007.1 hypothetical protein KTH_18760 [Thermosporothrix hazakensis]